MPIQIIVSGSEFNDFVERLPRRLYDDAKDAIKETTIDLHRNIVSSIPKLLHNRSGNLARSFKTLYGGKSIKTLYGEVYSKVIYAPLHEYGGSINPTGNKYSKVPGGPYINIPLPDNKTKAGVMRKTAGQVFNSGGYLAKSKRGNWIVFSKPQITSGKNKKPGGKPMFYLSKGVYIKPRLKLRAMHKAMIPVLLERLNKILDDK